MSVIIEILKAILSSIANFILEKFFNKTNSATDSAERYSSPPKPRKNNDYYFVSDLELEGRRKEEAELRKFCGLNENWKHQPNQEKFSWLIITGAGGTGKSKLCYEFQKELTKKTKWIVCYPKSNDIEDLKRSCHYYKKYQR